jgi:hypothetical protein
VAISFTQHAERKFQLPERHGVPVTRVQVEAVVNRPEQVFPQPDGTFIAQHTISERHVLRVVYREAGKARVVIAFYPGRRPRYEAEP